MPLYPYQDNNSKEIIKQWETHPSVLYQLPTGGGKTVVINDVIEKNIDKKILILVHRQEIIFQIRDRLKQKNVIAGVLIGNFEENIESDIIVASILTVARDTRLQKMLDRNFDIMIIDEAHHACSDSYIKTITNFKLHNPNYKLLGVTATPYRKDNKKLNKIFDVLIKGPTYSELRKDGYLADYICYSAKVDKLKEVELSGGDFKISSLSKFMRSKWLIEKAIKMYKDKGDNKQMLVFCVDKKHSIQVKEAYIKAGYTKIAHIDSDTSDEERKQINQDYRNGKIDIITSVQTLTEGVDLPETKVIQSLRPTLSIVLYLQLLGRGTRLKADGSKLIILDCSNNSIEHGLLDSDFQWNLNNDDPNPEKKLNKIVGKRNDGGFTADENEIEEQYLEVTEITHDEFLSQNENGVELAENENKEKEQQLLLVYKSTIDYLNNKCKLDGVSFIFKPEDVINYNQFNKIECDYKSRELLNLKFSDNKSFKIDLGWYSREASSSAPDRLIYGGKTTEFLTKDTNIKYLLGQWELMDDINKSKVDINKLKEKIRNIKEEKCIHKIDEQLSSGNYVFELNKSTNGHFRDVGWFEKIEFLDKPNRLKSTNRIKFGDGDRAKSRGYYSYSQKSELGSVKKEDLIRILFNNWFLK